ncbi:MAG: type VI secretion system baseplate subunit TssG, partial [Rhodospirillales bacterium]|nr:type VI secretion system baseplate subunit TssG [Rhodospirillales bacterium]
GVTDVEARLLLSPDQAPPSRLGLRQGGNRPRLGWTSWLGRPPQDRPAAITLRLASAFP